MAGNACVSTQDIIAQADKMHFGVMEAKEMETLCDKCERRLHLRGDQSTVLATDAE